MGVLAIISLIVGLAAFGYFLFRVIKISKTHEIGQEHYKIEGKQRDFENRFQGSNPLVSIRIDICEIIRGKLFVFLFQNSKKSNF